MPHPKQITLDGAVHEFFTDLDRYSTSPLQIDNANVLRMVARKSTRPEVMIRALLAYLRQELNPVNLNYTLSPYRTGQHVPEAQGAFHLGSVLTQESLLIPIIAHTDVHVRINTHSTIGHSVTVYPLAVDMLNILRRYHERPE